MTDTQRWYACPSCDVRWRSIYTECWSCGGQGVDRKDAAPHLTSGPITRAMTDYEWNGIRAREGLE